MQKRTLLQVINELKAGNAIELSEACDTILALYSMFTRSRMVIETIADKSGNAEHLYYTTQAFLGNLDTVSEERERWMNAIPSEWLAENDLRQREVTAFWDSIRSPQ